ncbi:integrase core domain protein-like protein, partial [Dinothrombium tinctorium]
TIVYLKLALTTNGTLAVSISLFVSDHQKDWDSILPFATFAYNTSVHAVTGFTPFELIFGRTAVLPQDIVMQNRTLGVDDPNDYFDLIKSWSQIAKESVKQAIESEQNSYTVRTNIKRESKFKEGDLVLIYTPFRKKGKAEKLLSRFVGPFRLVKQIGPVVFEVEKLANKKRDLVHVSRMKPYIERNERQREPEPEIERDETEIISDIENLETQPETENENSLRRSIRKRQQSMRLKDFILTLFYLILIMTRNVIAVFLIVPLIMWRKTPKPVMKGMGELFLDVKIFPPCNMFKFPELGPDDVVKGLKEWCAKQFEDDYINPLKNFCSFEPMIQIERTRPKRDLITIEIIITTTVVLGLGAYSTYRSSANAVYIKDLRQQLDEVQAALATEKIKNEANRKAILELTENVQKLSKSVKELVKEFVKIKKMQSKGIVAVTKVSQILSRAKQVLLVTQREWENNNVFEDLFDILNITVPCGKSCPFREMNPVHCIFDPLRQKLFLKIHMKLINRNLSIYLADPMTALQNISDKICVLKYTGPTQ